MKQISDSNQSVLRVMAIIVVKFEFALKRLRLENKLNSISDVIVKFFLSPKVERM